MHTQIYSKDVVHENIHINVLITQTWCTRETHTHSTYIDEKERRKRRSNTKKNLYAYRTNTTKWQISAYQKKSSRNNNRSNGERIKKNQTQNKSATTSTKRYKQGTHIYLFLSFFFSRKKKHNFIVCYFIGILLVRKFKQKSYQQEQNIGAKKNRHIKTIGIIVCFDEYLFLNFVISFRFFCFVRFIIMCMCVSVFEFFNK